MLENSDKNSSISSDALLAYRAQLASRIENAKKNRAIVATQETLRLNLINEREATIECANHMRSMYNNIGGYITGKRDESLDLLNVGVRQASMIVPDAGVKGVHVKLYDNKTAKVVTSGGLDVNLLEGGGYRTSMGIMMRSAFTAADSGALPLMLLDEAFVALSDNSNVNLREHLKVLSEHMLIIGIEQHRTLYEGIATQEYTFEKGLDAKTRIRRVM